MATQRLTARAILTVPCFQGFVGAGRVVAYAHAMGQSPTSPVPTSLKPASKPMPKGWSDDVHVSERRTDSPRRDWGLNANPRNRLTVNRTVA